MAERKQRVPLDPVVTQFIASTGRFPTGFELVMLREAQASIALDKGDVGTYAVDTRPVGSGGTDAAETSDGETSDS